VVSIKGKKSNRKEQLDREKNPLSKAKSLREREREVRSTFSMILKGEAGGGTDLRGGKRNPYISIKGTLS